MEQEAGENTTRIHKTAVVEKARTHCWVVLVTEFHSQLESWLQCGSCEGDPKQ